MYIEHFLEASIAIKIHMIAALCAFVLGALVLWRRKGTRLHRVNGRIWVALMMITAFSGFFIHEVRLWGAFSPIHLLSVLVMISLPWAIYEARTGRIDQHQRTMRSTYVGGMLVAGGFTFLPGRLNYKILFGDAPLPPQAAEFGWVLPLLGAMAVGIWFALQRRSA